MNIFPRKSLIFMTEFAHFSTLHHIFTVFEAILQNFCINSQSNIIYSLTSGTSQDIPDVPSPTPLAKRELICERYFVGTWSATPQATTLSALIPLHCTFSRKNLWTSCWDARGAPKEDNLIHFGPL